MITFGNQLNAFLASVEISIQAGCFSYAVLGPPLTLMNILQSDPIHIITVIVVLRNVSGTPLDTNPQICGPGIGGDLAITNYGLFCHLTTGLGFPIGTLCIKNILADGTIAQLTYPAFLVACPEQHQAITILIIY